jgi:Coenzyme PQQ synthesis protein D (PqqD)
VTAIRFVRVRGVPWRNIGDDVLLAPTDRHDLECLSATGGAVWRCLAAPRDLADLVTELAETFGLDPTAITADVEDLLGTMCQRGLVAQI